MKKPPLGIHSFARLIKDGYPYVDKTEKIFELISTPGKCLLYARPQRGGKALLISTLFELFSGNRELFKGLWIYDKIEWKKYPVIHLGLSDIVSDSVEELQGILNRLIDENVERLGVRLPDGYSICNIRFKELIRTAGERESVVVLVDEYDKPIIDQTGNKAMVQEYRRFLSGFYEVLKAADRYTKFGFFTGITGLSATTTLQGMNNFRDISKSPYFSTLFSQLFHNENQAKKVY